MLTPKKKLFAREYLKNGFNATKAAVSAGYSPKAAKQQGSLLLSDTDVRAIIDAKTNKVLDKYDISVERTLKELARLAFFDPKNLFEDDGSVKQIKDIDEDTRSVIGGFEVAEMFDGQGEQKHAIGLIKKVKIADRLSAIDKLMRHHSLYRDKVEVNVNTNLADRIAKARARK